MRSHCNSRFTPTCVGKTAIATAIADELLPQRVVGKASASTGASWGQIAIPSGATSAHVRIKTADAFVMPSPAGAEPTSEGGCSYPPNAVVVISCRGVNDGHGKLQHKQDGAAGAISATFYGNP